MIRYSFARDAQPKPIGVDISVEAADSATTPTGDGYPVERHRGRMRVELPKAPGPYTVHARTVTAEEAASEKTSVTFTRADPNGSPERSADKRDTEWLPPPLAEVTGVSNGSLRRAEALLADDPSAALRILRSHRLDSPRSRVLFAIARLASQAAVAQARLSGAPRAGPGDGPQPRPARHSRTR